MNLNQVTIPSNDLTIAVPFYQKLGLKLIVDSTPRYARFECPNGDATFSIHHQEELPKGNGTIVYFEVENVDQTVQEIKTKDITFEEDPIDQIWEWREARLKDPDGNQIIIFTAGETRKNPSWRIKD